MTDRTRKPIRLALAAGALSLALGSLAAPAFAQRDPAYEAARQSGQVGEKTDGYLGVVGGASPGLRKMVDDINIKRRALYAEKAQAAGATLQEYAFTAGCLAVARTAPGEKYQAPDGSWQTRTSAPPVRNPKCP
ncbi:YdbL family protein [Altericroceibacterium xinjiangense]|uniref:YdbL family protein n=1 Tax=Altericroceibacterium xinjiangense TaxID=762261 RepID=UPI000F7F97DC|nr:YdbL family protein [Altericroceibacterium xinjiangense]